MTAIRALAALLLLGIAACTRVASDGTASSGTTAAASELRVAMQDGPNTLQPLLSSNTVEAFLNRLTFDPLVTTKPDGTDVPVLAARVPTLRNGDISRDGLAIVYHLRRNVKWQDGAPFTSADVRFSFDAVMNPANNVISRNGFEIVSRVDTPDASTVVFHLKRKFAPFVDTVFGDSDSPYEIIPAHLLANYPNINTLSFNTDPVGTGPYKVVRWLHGDHIELVANDGYFLGKPKIARIIVRFIPDENSEINALRTRDIDWFFEASPQLYAILKSFRGINNHLADMNQYEGMALNTSHPALSDLRVRRAIEYAVDRSALVAKLTFGSATVADEDIPPYMWAHDADVRKYPYDPAEARRLLHDAGWRRGPDGILTKNGSRLSLVIVYNVANATRRAIAVQMQAELRAIGIEGVIKSYPFSLFTAPMQMGGIVQSGKFDLELHGWISGADPDNNTQFTCAAEPPNGNNVGRFCDPAVDAAEREALSNYDRTARKRAYATIESTIADQAAEVYFWWPHQINAVDERVKNVEPNLITEAWNAYQWSM